MSCFTSFAKLDGGFSPPSHQWWKGRPKDRKIKVTFSTAKKKKKTAQWVSRETTFVGLGWLFSQALSQGPVSSSRRMDSEERLLFLVSEPVYFYSIFCFNFLLTETSYHIHMFLAKVCLFLLFFMQLSLDSVYSIQLSLSTI